MSIGENILERENLPENIQKLSAQREIYTRAKNILLVQLIITVPIILVLSVFKILLESIFKFDIEWLIATYALILLIVDNFMIINKIKFFKEKAAGIQELFDCEVLAISWNKILIIEKPEITDIVEYDKLHQARRVQGDFANWYAKDIKNVPDEMAKIFCQNENITYDSRVRKKIMDWIKYISLVTLILLILIASIGDLSFRKFILNVAIPFLPVLGISVKWYYEQKNSIKNLKEIRSIQDSIWENFKLTKEIPNDIITRQIQDRIYLHRKTCALIPDFVYNKMRNNQEEQMVFSIQHYVKEYKKILQKTI
ncbi:MAG: S-4TM family putative pore-forming effector [Raineya sp.]|jgi:hypothetical protein|nr:S-4TM family putative pore-forming effector [Raineya sp.]